MRAWRNRSVLAALAALAAACEAPVPLGDATAGSASSGGAPDPWATPDTCAGGSYWSGQGTKDMSPGTACITCHGPGQGTEFVIAGTVFTTGHVPDACKATPAQQGDLGLAKVFVQDANGVVLTLTVWPSGNFMQKPSPTPLAFPITAWVSAGGRERHMLAAQMSGDCNACHTDAGDAGARGRIVLP
jgi:cytochrome c553